MSSQTPPAFDPSLTGSAADGIFGIATALERAALVYIPVPWEVTTSYGSGTAQGPDTVLNASPQLDLYLRGVANHFEKGFHLLPTMAAIASLNSEFKPIAKAIQEELETAGNLASRPDLAEAQQQVNAASAKVNQLVYQQAKEMDTQGKRVALIGGDHSSPLGLIQYLCEKFHGDLGVLHIDAHHDLRDAYQDFQFSHASIMKNVLDLAVAPSALVQVGIRDFSAEEAELAREHPAVTTFYDEDMKEQLFLGKTFAALVDEIVGSLPDRVYVSFDIDGLQPDLCPHTGTPVAGGLSLEQAQYLIKTLVKKGKTIVGFDLCEVAPDDARPEDQWDGNVGARVLFMLSSWMMESQGKVVG